MSATTQADFARLQGWNRSTVTRLKQAGRLVLDDRGHVEVEASLRRIEETGGMRFDVAARHAKNRGQAGVTPQPEAEIATPAASDATAAATERQPGCENRASAQARKESAAADLMEIELAQKRGNLIPREDVDAALKHFAAAARARLDVLADQLAPVVAPVTDMDEIHALLSEYHRGVLAGIADDLQRAEGALAAT